MTPRVASVAAPSRVRDVPNEQDAAFSSFAQQEYRRLVGALSLYCGDPEVAKDVAQDALVRALERWKSVRHKTSPAAWLFRTAFNIAHSRYRRQSTERRALEKLGDRADCNDPDVALILTVRRAVSSLPRRQREVVICRFYLHLTVDETAAQLGLTSGSVKVYTSRAFQSLRRALSSSSEPSHAR